MEKYIIQKAQKIVSALYLVTDTIKDSDAIKWEIREEGISFVSNALFLNSDVPIEKDNALQSFVFCSNKLVSFLSIASVSNLISSMNTGIIIHEIESIISFAQKSRIPHGYILSDSFFATDSALPPAPITQNKTIVVKDKKDNRQENILALLKKESNLTIKDFAKVIKDCSEKTIQRELSILVSKGVVKKAGERRWSTYSLI